AGGETSAAISSETKASAWITIDPPLDQDENLSRRAAQRGIDGVPEPVAEEVEAEHRQEDRDAGKRRDPPRRQEMLPALHEHVAPARQGRLGAEAEIREARLDQDRLAERQAALDDDDRDRVDEHVPSENARGAGAEGAGRVD